MKIFIENEAGSKTKHIYDEKKMILQETIEVALPYPFPYGFIPQTTSGDGDNVDVFIITDKPFKTGQIIDCQIIGLMEQFEYSWDPAKKAIKETDHNILAIPFGEPFIAIDEIIQQRLRHFVLHIFDNIQENKTDIGLFLNQNAALAYIKSCLD